MKSPRILQRLWRAYLGFSAHDGSLVAGGIAYYVALSFFPLMLVLVAGTGHILKATEFGQLQEQSILDAIALQASPDLSQQVKLALEAANTHAPTGGLIGFVTLVITAVAIFVQVDYAFDRIWNLGVVREESWPQWFGRHVLSRLKALAMLLGVGAFLLSALIASVVWSGVQKSLAAHNVEPLFSWSAGIALNIGLNFFAIALLYKFVPKARIYWREAFAGSLIAAPLWEVGRQLLAVYFLSLKYPTAYGIIGSFMVIMLWAYYAMYIVLFGAEYVRVRQRERVESRELEFEG